MSTVITPTVGRIVWYTPSTSDAAFKENPNPDGVYAAIVTRVWNDRMVNLAAFTGSGLPVARTSVQLVQEGDAYPANGHVCNWMPYQLGQAKKHEEGKKEDNAA